VKTRLLAVVLALASLVAVGLAGARARTALDDVQGFARVTSYPRSYVGIVSYDLPAFDAACRCAPNVAASYTHIGGTTLVSMGGAVTALYHGAVPLLELEPFGLSLSQIAAGRSDRWLTQYARAVRNLHAPVIMSFAPEANGTWYTWAFKHQAATAFVAAWRHVVSVFRSAGATRVKWAWIMNVNFPGSENIAKLWPGNRYVNILGLDGYFTSHVKSQSFQNLFSPSIVDMRSLSVTDPLLITETAVSPHAGKLAGLKQIIAGVSRYGLAGFIWFDVRQHGGVRYQNWQLEGQPTVLARYVRAVDKLP
jgi:hypothetical protein